MRDDPLRASKKRKKARIAGSTVEGREGISRYLHYGASATKFTRASAVQFQLSPSLGTFLLHVGKGAGEGIPTALGDTMTGSGPRTFRSEGG